MQMSLCPLGSRAVGSGVYVLGTVQQGNHKGTITFAKNSVAGYRGWVKKGNAKAKYAVAKT